jgi:hypothetical protein
MALFALYGVGPFPQSNMLMAIVLVAIFLSITEAAEQEAGFEYRRDAILSGVQTLRAAIDDVPNSAKWRLRGKVGERRVWYALPEEAGDAAHA